MSQLILTEFGKRLYAQRHRLNMSRRAMAEKIGVHFKTILNWEEGQTFIEDLGLMRKVNEAYEINGFTVLGEIMEKIANEQD